MTIDLFAAGYPEETSSALSPSSFDSLPSSLQYLHFRAQDIDKGALNLRRLANLRSAHIFSTRGTDVLDALPDSLEEFTLHFIRRSWDDAPVVKFPLSKLPPKIRVWCVGGRELVPLFDRKAPSTLEVFAMNWQERDLRKKPLKNFFECENLRILSMASVLDGPTPSAASSDLLPNLETCIYPRLPKNKADALAFLPKKLLTLHVQSESKGRPLSYKHMPHTLKNFLGNIVCAEHIADLPRSLKNLGAHPISEESAVSFPASAWSLLPPSLTKLEVDMALFESNQCVQVLPGTLETLLLFGAFGHLDTLSLPSSLSDSLKTLYISHTTPYNFDSDAESEDATRSMSNSTTRSSTDVSDSERDDMDISEDENEDTIASEDEEASMDVSENEKEGFDISDHEEANMDISDDENGSKGLCRSGKNRLALKSYCPSVFFTRLANPNVLLSIHLLSRRPIAIHSHTLANLPKSLTSLHMWDIEFENFGLPPGESVENSDWQNGALSRLPEGLRRLKLGFKQDPPCKDLDFMVFSRLPTRLSSFRVNTGQYLCKKPKKFISTLPKRLAFLEHHFYLDEPYEGEAIPKGFKAAKKEYEKIRKEYNKAVQQYYASDPFWGLDTAIFLPPKQK